MIHLFFVIGHFMFCEAFFGCDVGRFMVEGVFVCWVSFDLNFHCSFSFVLVVLQLIRW